jgi:hypothetical protein
MQGVDVGFDAKTIGGGRGNEVNDFAIGVGVEPLAELLMLFRGEVGKDGIRTALAAEFEGLSWISVHIFRRQYKEGGGTYPVLPP